MSTKYRAVCLNFFIVWIGYSQDASVAQSNTTPKATNNSPIVTQAPGGESAAMIFKSIIPPQLVNDMFGRRISDDYLAIQVTVFNTSEDEDLLINDVSVDYGALLGHDTCLDFSDPTGGSAETTSSQDRMAGQVNVRSLQNQNVNVNPGAAKFMAATSSRVSGSLLSKTVAEPGQQLNLSTCQTSSQELSILRGVAEKGQVLDPRNIVYRSLQAAGTIGGALTGVAGLGPILPKAVAAFNGPGLSAFTTAFPDYTVSQMNRLSDSAYAANTVVARQRSKVLVAFIPLQLFFKPQDIKKFRKDAYSAFMGIQDKPKHPAKQAPQNTANDSNREGPFTAAVGETAGATAKGLKDLKVRVAYNFIVSTEDVPPILSALAIDDSEVLNLLQKKQVHGTIVGRFLDSAKVTSSNPDVDVALDSSQPSNDTRLNFLITPKKAMFPQRIDLTVTKAKTSSDISRPVTGPQPMPSLTAVDPKEMVQGADQNVTLTGNNFFDIGTTLSFWMNNAADKSLVVSNVVVVSPTTITATIGAKNAQPGTYGLFVGIGQQSTGRTPFTVKAAQ